MRLDNLMKGSSLEKTHLPSLISHELGRLSSGLGPCEISSISVGMSTGVIIV